MKKIFSLTLVAIFALSTVSCVKDYTARNTNSEQATNEMKSHDNLAAGSAISQMIANVLPSYQNDGENEYGSSCYQVVQGLTGNIFSGYEGASNPGFKETNVYNLVADGWSKALFEDAYVRSVSAWPEMNAIREFSPLAAAWADVLKVATLHRVTDAYGPIAYSGLDSDAEHIPYDSQQEVYTAMLDELDAAIQVIVDNVKSGNNIYLKAFDNVFYGDMAKWAAYANTLRLRLATRLAYADNALYMSEAAKAISSEAGFISEDVMLHPGVGAWEYPIYVIARFNQGDSKPGATITTYMNSYNDPRRESYFVPGTDGDYHGVRIGALVDNNYPSNGLWAAINCTISDPLKWMSGAEAQFLLSEYYLRSGDVDKAKQMYEEGVKASFAIEGVSGADAYLAGTDGVGSYIDPVNNANSYGSNLTATAVSWNSQTTEEGHLEQIITQKYIAGFPEGMEAWSEFRRTGYPKVIPTATNNSGGMIDTDKQIRRLIYPTSEYSANNANVKEAVTILVNEAKDAASVKGDNGGTRVWWDRK